MITFNLKLILLHKKCVKINFTNIKLCILYFINMRLFTFDQ